MYNRLILTRRSFLSGLAKSALVVLPVATLIMPGQSHLLEPEPVELINPPLMTTWTAVNIGSLSTDWLDQPTSPGVYAGDRRLNEVVRYEIRHDVEFDHIITTYLTVTGFSDIELFSAFLDHEPFVVSVCSGKFIITGEFKIVSMQMSDGYGYG